jgi:hypothetical protein
METSKLLPTPTGQEVEHPQAQLTKTGRRKSAKGTSHSLNLADRVMLLPTPNTMEAMEPKTIENIVARNKKYRLGRTYLSQNLRELVAYGQRTLDGKPLTSDSSPEKLLLTPSAVNIEGGADRYEKRKAYRESIGRHYTPGGLAEQIKMALTSSQEGFPASRSAKRGSAKVQRTVATCGLKCLEQYESLRPLGLLGKTYLASLLGTTALSSSRCALTWKLKATRSGRLWFQLAPSTHRTAGTESGLLHTAAAHDPGIRVERLVTKDGQPAKVGERAYDRETGRLAQVGLTQQVQMIPTPRAGNPGSRPNGKGGKILAEEVSKIGQETGERLQLQPAFVEWMMGYRKGWLDFPTEAPLAKASGDSKR